jgi:hypothetical protein
MRAIAVFPRRPNSAHLAELPKSSVNDVPGGRGVLVKVLRVGVDGTDREINAGEYGAAGYGQSRFTILVAPMACRTARCALGPRRRREVRAASLKEKTRCRFAQQRASACRSSAR